ncbi:MAG: thioesterase family protein [Thermodesulfobacteriota bacterium]
MHQFDRDIALEQQADRLFSATVTPNWSVNNNPDGGYLMAMMANAVLQHAEKQWITIFTANFVSRCVPGEADLSVAPLGASARFERWQASLEREGDKKVFAMCTLTDPGAGDAEIRYEDPPPVLASRQDCVEFPVIPGYTLFHQMDVRLDPACAGWLTTGNLSDVSEQKGWIRFKNDRPFDMLSVLLATDAFPPAVLASHGMVAWVPTLEMSVNIRRLPSSPWLKCAFRSRFVHNGIVEEDGQIWDEDDHLVAVSRQIAQFRKSV